ncbi:BHLH140 [Symbiodinium pilosum]|uniref:BHLH140 protein n=1 Tax=Symbiodinium pilosum TaxID=2952 RepID=A0A812V4A1_SYMPI|nr:BHLH140 [Symbiodinium pilosum]
MAGDRSSLDSEDTLRAIFKSGVTTIVCLQSRQETSVAVDYRKKAKALHPNVAFVEQPIPDQEVADDAVVEDLVSQLLDRLAAGEVLYVHCRGGHGRTGTICAILLGRLYKLSPAEAMARTQVCHDVRQQPVFAAEGYQETKDGSSCVILFPSQRQQVIRLLRGEAVVPVLDRASSAAYGPGASKYPVEKMMEWQGKAKEAADALNNSKQKAEGKEDLEDELQKAVKLFWEAAKLRPDFSRGYLGLARALRMLKQPADAKHAVLHGLEHCADDGALLQELQKIDKELEKQTILEEDAPAPAAEPAAPAIAAPAMAWKPKVAKPALVMLMGLPGCGKSTFADQLVKSGGGWERLCQDELSGRDEFERGIGPIAKDSRKRLILDRTNVAKSDRQCFLGLAFNPKAAVCVHFAASAAECEERVAKRTDHPTIRYGGGRGAVRGMADALQLPTLAEGFEEIITIQNFAEADHLLKCWGAEPAKVSPVGFFKFPTTPHIFDLTNGKALTESDRLLSETEAQQFYDGKTTVIVEEKIDGANLGISLTESYEPLFQNRAHYVSSSYATQWKALDTWWEEHGWAVCQLLEPEVEVLFGEWLWARHSVAYTKLPAYFVAFDIYNKRAGRFLSVRERNRRLEGLDIPVPEMSITKGMCFACC